MMSGKIISVMIVFIIVAAGCASQSKERTYWDLVRERDFEAERYKLRTKEEIAEECYLISREIDKLKPKLQLSDHEMRDEALKDIRWFEKKASDIDCDFEPVPVSWTPAAEKDTADASKNMREQKHVTAPAPEKIPDAEMTADQDRHPPEPAVATGSSLSFDECFNKCKELTGRTNEECFDTCLSR